MIEKNILQNIIQYILNQYTFILMNYDVREIKSIKLQIKKVGFTIFEDSLTFDTLKEMVNDIKYYVLHKTLKQTGNLYNLLKNINSLETNINNPALTISNPNFNFVVVIDSAKSKISNIKTQRQSNYELEHKLDLSIKDILILISQIKRIL
jgi:predicted amino acid-binding ACT domain protein